MQNNNWTLFDSFRCAVHGVGCAILEERNMRIHVSIAALVFYFAYHLQLAGTEWCFLVLAAGCVFAGEIFNTAIEHTIDAKIDRYQEYAKKAKDAAAGGELVMALMAAVIGMIVFLQNGRLHTVVQLCVSSPLRSCALVIYVLIAIWFICSGKKQKRRGKAD